MLAVVGAVTVVIAWSWREPIKARIGTPAGRLLLSRRGRSDRDRGLPGSAEPTVVDDGAR